MVSVVGTFFFNLLQPVIILIFEDETLSVTSLLFFCSASDRLLETFCA